MSDDTSDSVTMVGTAQLARYREIERLVRDLFLLERDVGAMPAAAIAEDDERDEQDIERRLKDLVGLPTSREPELQHQRRCAHPSGPCSCRRSHLLAEGRRLARMIDLDHIPTLAAQFRAGQVRDTETR